MDLAGPLMASLFRQLQYKLTQELRKSLDKKLPKLNQDNVEASIKSLQTVITNGLNYSLSTGE